ncbi:MAG: type II restriction endonuclease [candidate division WOR-3 bacterium]
MRMEAYAGTLGIRNLDSALQLFLDTLVDTNRDHRFFVDWDKVERQVLAHKVELNILNSLIGSRNFDRELEDILTKYPQVISAIPVLLALRGTDLKVIEDFQIEDSDIAYYDFTPRRLTGAERVSFVSLFAKTGLARFFQELSSRSIQDYAMGVEVGLDTHARKNRGGAAMELALKPLVYALRSDTVDVLYQKKFGALKYSHGINPPSPLADRKADFLLVRRGGRMVNIEVNFYTGTGSKPQEIVDSYILRQEELARYGMGFIWVTDGHGWRGQRNQLKKAFKKLNFLLNLHFCRKGLLRRAVRDF